MQVTPISIFVETPNDGRFPIIDKLPMQMQQTVDKISRVSGVAKVTSFLAGSVLQLNVFLRPKNAYLQNSEVIASIDKSHLNFDRMVIHGRENKISFKLSIKKELLN